MPEEHGISSLWLLGLAGFPFKAVWFHSLIPQQQLASTIVGDRRGREALRIVSLSTENCGIDNVVHIPVY